MVEQRLCDAFGIRMIVPTTVFSLTSELKAIGVGTIFSPILGSVRKEKSYGQCCGIVGAAKYEQS